MAGTGFLPELAVGPRLRALLDLVPEDTQEMAVHYFVDQMSHDEIALLMSVPRRTIGYRLEQFRAKVLAMVRADREELVS